MNSINNINEPIDKIIRILNESNIEFKKTNKVVNIKEPNIEEYECKYNNKISIVHVELKNNIVINISCDYSIISNDISVFEKIKEVFKPKALVCQGGGAKGAWQAGVIYSLMKYKLNFKTFAGTSVGALNSAFAYTNQIELLKKLWEGITFGKLLKTYFLLIICRLLPFSYNPIYKIISKYITEDNLKDASNIYKNFYCWVTNYSKGISELKQYTKRCKDSYLQKYITASTALPIFLKPMKITNNKYVDGGLSHNNPTTYIESSECDEIINIVPTSINGSNSTNSSFKLLSIVFDEQIRSHLETLKLKINLNYTNSKPKIFIITPSKKLKCGLIPCSNKAIIKDFELGIKDGENFIKNSKDYFIDNYNLEAKS